VQKARQCAVLTFVQRKPLNILCKLVGDRLIDACHSHEKKIFALSCTVSIDIQNRVKVGLLIICE
jgi:hypothetical protein